MTVEHACRLPSAPRTGEVRREWVLLVVAALVLLALRLPFLPPRLGDIDSLNFDLGVHDYDPTAHRPHPPGYPLFILLAKTAHAFISSHAAALGVVSAVAGALSVFPLYFLIREFTSRSGAALVCILTLANPLVWVNSVRPMSDMTGFFAALVGQCLLLKGARAMTLELARDRRLWHLGVLAAGLAMGVRLQALFLVGPILVYGWIRHREVRLSTAMWLALGIAVWAIPLMWLSHGPWQYASSFARLVSDALPVEPLLVQLTPRRAAFALWDVLVAPWASPWVAGPVLLLGVLGAARWVRSDRPALGYALLLFLPYGIYHYLVQMTATIRYGIPLVPVVALLSTVALLAWRPRRLSVAVAAGVAFVVFASVRMVPALAAYHASASPAAQALDYVRAAAQSTDFVVSGNYGFTRHLAKLESDFDVRFPTLHEDLRPVFEYWKQGGRKPVLFLKNPMRTSLLLVGRDSQSRLQGWSWPASLEPLMKGERPSTVELWRLDPPRWFCDTGFLVTLEAGVPEDVASRDHRFYVRPTSTRQALIASGSIAGGDEAIVTLKRGDTVLDHWRVQREFTVRSMVAPLSDTTNYVPLTLVAETPVLFKDLWLAPEDRHAIRPAHGFYMPERDNRARLFRWVAPVAEAAAYAPTEGARLRIRGQIPIEFYQLPLTVALKWNGVPFASFAVTTRQFEFDGALPDQADRDAWGTLTLTSSQSFIPDEAHGNGDRRRLSLRIDDLILEALPSSSPGGGI